MSEIDSDVPRQKEITGRQRRISEMNAQLEPIDPIEPIHWALEAIRVHLGLDPGAPAQEIINAVRLLSVQRQVTEVENTDLRNRRHLLEGKLTEPIPMRLTCPGTRVDGTPCGRLHIDEGEFATKRHHTHACQICGMVWRPCVENTVGVEFLPNFKNEPLT